MENIFKGLTNDSKVTSSNLRGNARFNYSGDITINKGGYSETFSFYCGVDTLMYEGFVSIDDLDINEVLETSFNGMPIDDTYKFKESLKNAGLTTLANSLEIDYKEQKKQVAIQLTKSKEVKAIFGDDVRFFETLSESEEAILKLSYAIKNYKSIQAYSNCISKYVVVEDGVKIKPELKVLKAALKELKTK